MINYYYHDHVHSVRLWLACFRATSPVTSVIGRFNPKRATIYSGFRFSSKVGLHSYSGLPRKWLSNVLNPDYHSVIWLLQIECALGVVVGVWVDFLKRDASMHTVQCHVQSWCIWTGATGGTGSEHKHDFNEMRVVGTRKSSCIVGPNTT